MRFTTWLKQQRYRDDAVGHLARNFIADGCKQNFSDQFLRDGGASCEAMMEFKMAQKEYNKNGAALEVSPPATPRMK